MTTSYLTSPRAEVSREPTSTVLLAYAAERDYRRRAALYAKDISPRLNAGEPFIFNRLPLRAAQDVGTLASEIVSQRTLELLFARRPWLRSVTTDFSDEPAKVNQQIITRTVGLPSVENFGSAASEATDTDFPVTLDLLKETRFTFPATEWAGTNRDLVREHAEAMSAALGAYLADALFGLVTTAFTEETVKASDAIDYTTLTGIVKAMNVAGVPEAGRFGCVNSDVAEAFRNDELLLPLLANSGNSFAHWASIEGFTDIWEYPSLPANDIHLTGFFGSKSALLLASRLLASPETLASAGYPGRASIVQEPMTGLTVLANTWVEQVSLAVNTRLVLLAGIARGQLGCGHRLVSEAGA